ncbi:MAG TPA: hypothetical protein VFG01_07385 [Acidobacteriota bacterium]|nr:hypothetical protein [Acidobacteriota bacterium]
MGQFIILLTTIFALLTTPPTPVSNNIQRAFLQNNPHSLYSLFPKGYHVNFSFPEPISFSDQLTDQQAYFLFQKIFSDYLTFEFYSLSEAGEVQNRNYIYKARWSFKDKNNNNQYVFHLFFLLKESEKGTKNKPGKWNIIEIKAERI